MIYLVTIFFTICFVLNYYYQFEEEKVGFSNEKCKWHPYGMAMRVLLFVSLVTYHYFPFDKWDFLICIGLNIILDLGLNIALGVRLFYTGQTTKIDKVFGKAKWYMYAIILIGSLIGKIIFSKKNK